MTVIRSTLLVVLALVAIGRLLVERSRRWDRYTAIKANHALKTYRYGPGMDKADPAMRKRREGERDIAEMHRKDARKVETKEKSAKRIHEVAS